MELSDKTVIAKPASCHALRIRLPLTCWKMATTSARFRNCRAQGCQYDHDLHPRVEPRWQGSPQPSGSTRDWFGPIV